MTRDKSTKPKLLRVDDGRRVVDYLDGKPIGSGDRIIIESPNRFSHEAIYTVAGPNKRPQYCIDDACFPIDNLVTVRRPISR